VTSDNPRTEDPLAIIGEIEAGIRTPKVTLEDFVRYPDRSVYLVIPTGGRR